MDKASQLRHGRSNRVCTNPYSAQGKVYVPSRLDLLSAQPSKHCDEDDMSPNFDLSDDPTPSIHDSSTTRLEAALGALAKNQEILANTLLELRREIAQLDKRTPQPQSHKTQRSDTDDSKDNTDKHNTNNVSKEPQTNDANRRNSLVRDNESSEVLSVLKELVTLKKQELELYGKNPATIPRAKSHTPETLNTVTNPPTFGRIGRRTGVIDEKSRTYTKEQLIGRRNIEKRAKSSRKTITEPLVVMASVDEHDLREWRRNSQVSIKMKSNFE